MNIDESWGIFRSGSTDQPRLKYIFLIKIGPVEPYEDFLTKTEMALFQSKMSGSIQMLFYYELFKLF